MIKKNKKVVSFVPIKLESRRVEKKNLIKFNGKPLYKYILETLSKVKNIDQIYLFCSDELNFNDLPKGVKFLKRDKKLDHDDTLGAEIYDAFLSLIDADIYVLAHATSPFLSPSSIEFSIDKVISENYDSAFSVYKQKTFAWYKDKPINYSIEKVIKTQQLEPIYTETSGFYIFKKELWQNEKKRVGYKPYKFELNNIEAIDIDDNDDVKLTKIILEKSNA
jgi:CMP-N-acetylneuraminic acid synthetase